MGVFCTHCGHQNPAGADFCSSCGNSLATVSEPTVAIARVEPGTEGGGEVAHEVANVTVGDLEAGGAELVVKRGPDVGARFPLDSELTKVGRHPESEILLDDVTVSRRHAEFLRLEGQIVVKDVGSLNGTYVNRERIDETTLSDGDEVQIGKFKLLFRIAAPAEHA
jgi:pSer/pThr/pTyr-binding forkhead associated (FHA) protein